MQSAIAAFGLAMALLAFLERLYGVWLCRKAFQGGRGVRWSRGLRPSVDAEAQDRFRSTTAYRREASVQQPDGNTQARIRMAAR